jgi:hypothetical protein
VDKIRLLSLSLAWHLHLQPHDLPSCIRLCVALCLSIMHSPKQVFNPSLTYYDLPVSNTEHGEAEQIMLYQALHKHLAQQQKALQVARRSQRQRRPRSRGSHSDGGGGEDDEDMDQSDSNDGSDSDDDDYNERGKKKSAARGSGKVATVPQKEEPAVVG